MGISKYLGLVLLFAAYVSSERTYDLVLEKIEKVQIDPLYFDAGTLRVTRMNRTHNVLRGDFEFFKEVNDGVKVTILSYEQFGTEYKRSAALTWKDQSLCEFLDTEKLGASDFKEASNLPKNCPIPPGKYNVDNFLLNPERFPKYVTGNNKKWRGDIIVKDKDDLMWAHIQLYFHVDRKL